MGEKPSNPFIGRMDGNSQAHIVHHIKQFIQPYIPTLSDITLFYIFPIKLSLELGVGYTGPIFFCCKYHVDLSLKYAE